MEKNAQVPILILLDPDQFWSRIREIFREEISRNQKELPFPITIMETPGLTEKPLFKMNEVCSLFKVTKPTIYDWVKCGKLKKVKIRSRVYFLGEDIRKLIQA
jgi:excisionase family DNA binding protein